MTELQEIRRARGLTCEALGYLADVDTATVSRIERGLVVPRRETVVKMARALGMSVRRLAAMLDGAREPVA